MMGIRNGHQAQLDNTMPPAVAWAERRPRASATWSSAPEDTPTKADLLADLSRAVADADAVLARLDLATLETRVEIQGFTVTRFGPLPRRGALCDAHRADHLDREASHWSRPWLLRD